MIKAILLKKMYLMNRQIGTKQLMMIGKEKKQERIFIFIIFQKCGKQNIRKTRYYL